MCIKTLYNKKFFLYQLNISILVEMTSSNIDFYKEQFDTGKLIKKENVTFCPIKNEKSFLFKIKEIYLKFCCNVKKLVLSSTRKKLQLLG